MRTALRVGLPLTILALLCIAAGRELAVAQARLGEPFDAAGASYVGSAVCAECHGGRERSWYATFHRTMTQEAGPHSVQGQFDGRDFDYLGVRVRPLQENDRYYFEYRNPSTGTLIERVSIDRTVGSNRYQQYLTRLAEDGTYVRLHYLWHNGDQRWVHMNAAFLGPDDRPFDSHVAIWNQNCIFCHNTGPKPGMTNYDEMRERARRGEPVDSTREARFESTVAELGVACESCHGPGAVHMARADGFWSRWAMRLWPGRDTSIVNPVRLDAVRATHVCAQCHAQRVPRTTEALREWVHGGPSFRPGMDLLAHVEPVFAHTTVPLAGNEDLFRLRFWNDGTPRLTAYEYQGLHLSPCHQQAELSCMDCHSMHAGDPKGQITERNRGNAPCLRCHQEYRSVPALEAHSRHAASSPGSLCYNCHMPHLNYGVMAIHRSHRIEIPDVSRDAAAGRPNACLNCHLDMTVVRAAQALDGWDATGGPGTRVDQRADGGPANISEMATTLMGDPVQKAVIAWRAGHPDHAQRGIERAWMVPYLLAAMDDIYPSTRRFASRSLAEILKDWTQREEVADLASLLSDFDFVAEGAARQLHLERLLEAWARIDKGDWPPPPPDSGITVEYTLPDDLRDMLVALGRRQDKQISIGE